MKAFSFIKNKYFIALLLYVVWMLFFDMKDWKLIYERSSRLDDLKRNEKLLTQDIKDTREELQLLQRNAETIETYAREKYYMKKDNEDLFIVKTP